MIALQLAFLLVSQGASAEDAHREIAEVLTESPAATNYRLAPPAPHWPEWLPHPRTEPDGSETCFPAPTDYALNMHLAYWEFYPGECQRRIDIAWGAFERAMDEINNLAVSSPPPAVDGWATWEVALVVAGAVTLTAGIAFGAGYWAGWVHE